MAPRPAAPGLVPPRHRRALIIDDESAVGRLLSRQLSARGFLADVVHESGAALAAIERQHYDLVLCDAHLEGSSGFDLYDEVCTARPDVGRSFVFISGDSIDPTVIEFTAARHVPLLAKPFTGAQLDAAIKSLPSPSTIDLA